MAPQPADEGDRWVAMWSQGSHLRESSTPARGRSGGPSQFVAATGAIAGFAWRDPEAGGDTSMLWYREAVGATDPSRREAGRKRLLAYNEDDVIATLTVRDWLAREAPKLPRIAALDRTWPKHLPAREHPSRKP